MSSPRAALPVLRFVSLNGAVAVALASLLTTACSADADRPGSEHDGSAQLVSAAPSSHDRQICEPGASEICFLQVPKPDGTVDCPESIRFCASDGTRWHDCGHFDVTEDGRAVPPSDDTPAPAQPE